MNTALLSSWSVVDTYFLPVSAQGCGFVVSESSGYSGEGGQMVLRVTVTLINHGF